MVLSGDLSQTLITSARLTLRAFTAVDAPETFAETNDRIAKYMSWNAPVSEKAFRAIWQGHISSMKAGKELHLVIRLTITNEFLGRAGLHQRMPLCWKPGSGSRSRRAATDMGERPLLP